ncbi:MAG: ABC transporter permease [Chloroflexota bacterium]|nr:ABC transporter permease [Chloroflexia bacterium]MDQ3226957.1 ABC transporter permease [Chloroflexota bacterium]
MSLSIHASVTRSALALPATAGGLAWLRAGIVWLPLVILLVVTVAGRALAPYDPDAVLVTDRLQPPSLMHPMGTDPLGRDVLSRVMTGARNTVPNVFFILISALTIGVLMGVVAGYAGGKIDTVLMRITDVFLAFPALVLALAIVGMLGANVRNAIIAIIIVWWPWYARLVRGQVLSIKNELYVDAARSLGCPAHRILLHHVLPNSMAPVGVQALLDIGAALLTTAALGYLGVGAQPPSSEWGAMLAQGRQFFLDAWWLTGFPGLAIFVTVLIFNGAGERLRAKTLSGWSRI